MSREHRPFVGTEVGYEVVGHPDTAVEQAALPGGPVIGDASLEKMSETVLFMDFFSVEGP